MLAFETQTKTPTHPGFATTPPFTSDWPSEIALTGTKLRPPEDAGSMIYELHANTTTFRPDRLRHPATIQHIFRHFKCDTIKGRIKH